MWPVQHPVTMAIEAICSVKAAKDLQRRSSITCTWSVSIQFTRHGKGRTTTWPNSYQQFRINWHQSVEVQQTANSKCLAASPDTDVYMIGLPLYHGEILYKSILTREVLYLYLKALIIVPRSKPAQTQSLYFASGCDYTSQGISKSANFTKNIYKHAVNHRHISPQWPSCAHGGRISCLLTLSDHNIF